MLSNIIEFLREKHIISYGIYRRINDFVFWLKNTFIYKPHRAKHGWAPNDTWALDNYLTDVIIESVEHLRIHTHGYPSRYKTAEEWDTELKYIIQAFKDYKNFDADSANRREELHKLHGIQSFREFLKQNPGMGFVEAMQTYDDDKKFPDGVLKEFYEQEQKRHLEIKERMKKIIDVWDDLWD